MEDSQAKSAQAIHDLYHSKNKELTKEIQTLKYENKQISEHQSKKDELVLSLE